MAVHAFGVGVVPPALGTSLVFYTILVSAAIASRPGKFLVGRADVMTVHLKGGSCIAAFGSVMQEERIITVCVVETYNKLHVRFFNRWVMVIAVHIIVKVE